MKGTVFLTGASSGIGKELTKVFLENGWKVIASARRKNLITKGLRLPKKYVEKNLLAIKIDITKKNNLKKQISKAFSKFDIPDIIILNAGTNNPNKNHLVKVEETKYIFDTNFFGTINCIEEIIPFIKKKKYSQLVVMSSVAGYRGLPYAAAYCSSKAALTNYCESIYHQCKLLGINVRLINPGFIKTPLTDKNDFKMPLIIAARSAALIIYKKILTSKSFEISLPFIFCLIMKLLKILPYSIYFRITKVLLKN